MAYFKHSYAIHRNEMAYKHSSTIKLLMINIVVQCIWIALFMFTIVVQYTVIDLLMISALCNALEMNCL